MKRLFAAVILAITLCFATNAQQMSRSEFNDIIKEFNGSCPEKLDDGMVLSKVYLAGDYLIFAYTMTPPQPTIEELESIGDFLSKEMLNSFKGNSDMETFLQVCKELKISILFKFSDKSGKSFTARTSYKDY